MERRTFLKKSFIATGIAFTGNTGWTKEYLTVEQARKVLWGATSMTAMTVTLTDAQVDAIEDASDMNVRNKLIKAWKTSNGGWFILDTVIGKHENIDMAFALTKDGKVKGMEILTYRESYGHQVRNERWRAQFHGKDYTEYLKLDKQIKNISGATLSCRHLTDAINRINHTWHQILRHL